MHVYADIQNKFKFLIFFRLSSYVYVVFIYKVPYLHACLLVVVLFLVELFHLSNAAIFIVETSYVFSFSPFHAVLLYVIIQNSDSKFLLLFAIYLYHNWWVLAPIAVINSAFCCCSGNTSCTLPSDGIKWKDIWHYMRE